MAERIRPMPPSSSTRFAGLLVANLVFSDKKLGRGADATVYEVDWNGTLCAAKRLHEILLEDDSPGGAEKFISNFEAECMTWSKLRHPGVVQFLGVYLEPNSRLPILIMEKMDTSLRKYLEDNKKDKFPLHPKAFVLRQVSQALAYLHNQNPTLVHHDLSPNNVLINVVSFAAKMTDFGMSRAINPLAMSRKSSIKGTLAFMSPEALQDPPRYNEKLDVFSFGNIILSTITHKWPEPCNPTQYKGDQLIALDEFQRRERYVAMFTAQEEELFLPTVRQCLENRPDKRPSSAVLVRELRHIELSFARGSHVVTPIEQLQQHLSTKEEECKQMSEALWEKNTTIQSQHAEILKQQDATQVQQDTIQAQHAEIEQLKKLLAKAQQTWRQKLNQKLRDVRLMLDADADIEVLQRLTYCSSDESEDHYLSGSSFSRDDLQNLSQDRMGGVPHRDMDGGDKSSSCRDEDLDWGDEGEESDVDGNDRSESEMEDTQTYSVEEKEDDPPSSVHSFHTDSSGHEVEEFRLSRWSQLDLVKALEGRNNEMHSMRERIKDLEKEVRMLQKHQPKVPSSGHMYVSPRKAREEGSHSSDGDTPSHPPGTPLHHAPRPSDAGTLASPTSMTTTPGSGGKIAFAKALEELSPIGTFTMVTPPIDRNKAKWRGAEGIERVQGADSGKLPPKDRNVTSRRTPFFNFPGSVLSDSSAAGKQPAAEDHSKTSFKQLTTQTAIKPSPSSIVGNITEGVEQQMKEVKKTESSLLTFGQFTIGNLPSFESLASKGSTSSFEWMKEGAGVGVSTGPPLFSLGKEEDKEGIELNPEEEADIHFKPVVSLHEKYEVKRGEEEEDVVFTSRAKLYRFDGNEWKERGVGELKMLCNRQNGKVRLLMRRDQVLKICCNHFLSADMTLHPMAGSDRAWSWFTTCEFSEGEARAEKLAARFKNPELAMKFKEAFEGAKLCQPTVEMFKVATKLPVSAEVGGDREGEEKEDVQGSQDPSETSEASEPASELCASVFPNLGHTAPGSWECPSCLVVNGQDCSTCPCCGTTIPSAAEQTTVEKETTPQDNVRLSALNLLQHSADSWSCPTCLVDNDAQLSTCPCCRTAKPVTKLQTHAAASAEPSPVPLVIPVTSQQRLFRLNIPFTLDQLSGGTLNIPYPSMQPSTSDGQGDSSDTQPFESLNQHSKGDPNIAGEENPEEEADIHCKPVVSLPKIYEVKRGEEEEDVVFMSQAKLYHFDNEWKEWGVGQLKILYNRRSGKVRLLMRRDQVLTVCCYHFLSADMTLHPMAGSDRAWSWFTSCEFSEGEARAEKLAARFKNPELAMKFKEAFEGTKLCQPTVELVKTATELPVSAEVRGDREGEEKEDVQGSQDPSETSEASELASELRASGFPNLAHRALGSWECPSCLVVNGPDCPTCPCCGTTIPSAAKQTTVEKEALSQDNVRLSALKLPQPSANSWSCTTCLVDNNAKSSTCPCCGTARPVTKLQTYTAASAVPPQGPLGISVTTKQGLFSTLSFPQLPLQLPPAGGRLNNPFPLGPPTSGRLNIPFPSMQPSTSDGQGDSSDTQPFGSLSQHSKDDPNIVGEENPEEEADIHFKPVVSLPEKYKVKRGEEEDVVFMSWAKLYRFGGKEWKEWGVGELKMLCNRRSGKVRLLMRRDQVLKICCNHFLSADMTLHPMAGSDRAWSWFTSGEFSEGEARAERLAARFRNPELAMKFKEAFEQAQKYIQGPPALVDDQEGDSVPTDAIPELKDYSSVAPDDLKGTLTPPVDRQVSYSTDGSECQPTLFIPPTTSHNPSAKHSIPVPLPSVGEWECAQCKKWNPYHQLLCVSCKGPIVGNKAKWRGSEGIERVQGADSGKLPPKDRNVTSRRTPFFNFPGSVLSDSSAAGKQPEDHSKTSFKQLTTQTAIKPSPSSVVGNITEGVEQQMKEVKKTESSLLTFGQFTIGNLPSFKSLASKGSTSSFEWMKEGAGVGVSTGPPLFSLGKEEDKEGIELNPEEEADIHFKPVVSLHEKYEVKRGEEEEDVVFTSRAKLYRFDGNEWKERGVGELKMLCNRRSGKVRLLMRRDQVLKICCNHFLSADMTLHPMAGSDRAWSWFTSCEFSEGEARAEKLAARFKNPELAMKFKEAFEGTIHTLCQPTVELVKTATELPVSAEVGGDREGEEKEDVQGSQDPSETSEASEPASELCASVFPNLGHTAPGSWECPSCLVVNGPDCSTCPCCGTTIPSAAEQTRGCWWPGAEVQD